MNYYRNCRVSTGELCGFAPAGDVRNTCLTNRDKICLKNSCKCREGWILDPETGYNFAFVNTKNCIFLVNLIY